MDWKSVLSSVAPVLGGSIGGPFGAAATRFAVEKLTGKAPATEANAEAMLSSIVEGASPEKLAELKSIDADFKVKMAELGFKEKQLHVQDRGSAREMAAKTSIAPQVILSIVYTIGYFFVLYFFMSGQIDVPATHEVMFGSLIGVLSAAQVQIMNFWMGSSSGSKTKTAKLNG
jgi:hypothetical protein